MQLDWKAFLKSLAPALVAALLALVGAGGVTQVSGCGRPPCACPPPPAPPDPKPEPKPDPKPPEPQPATDPTQAIGRLAMANSFCSATVVNPPLPDGRRTLVSAAHCFSRVGESCLFTSRAGVGVRCSVIAMDKTSDVAILTTDSPAPTLPWVRVAARTPAAGTRILHAGFGQHIPGNTEHGVVVGGPTSRRQVQYRLSVSPGDSGGGICLTEGGELLSPTCCTTCLGCVGDVWGGSPERVAEMLASPVGFIDLPPAVMPAPPKFEALPAQMPGKKD